MVDFHAVTSLHSLSLKLEQAIRPVSGQAEPPRDSIAGALQALQHGVIDGIVGAVPRIMRTSSQADHGRTPVQIMMRGQNSQGLASLLLVTVKMALQGARIEARLTLFAPDRRPVAQRDRAFQIGPADSVKVLVKQFGEWLGQAEALQMAPVGAGGVAVQLTPAGTPQAPAAPAAPAGMPMGAGGPL